MSDRTYVFKYEKGEGTPERLIKDLSTVSPTPLPLKLTVYMNGEPREVRVTVKDTAEARDFEDRKRTALEQAGLIEPYRQGEPPF